MDGSPDRLIGALAADLQPVRSLLPPALRTLLWLLLVAAVAAALATFANVSATWHRLSAVSDMWLAALGSIATMATAAFAAFELGLPDRSRSWALLPLPAAMLWVGASGLGCMRGVLLPGTLAAAPRETLHCLLFIVGLSVPLSAAFMVMLRRGYSLAPPLTAAMAGLAAAAAAATLLNLPSLRCRSGRSSRARDCRAGRGGCGARGRRPDAAKFFCRACNRYPGRFELAVMDRYHRCPMENSMIVRSRLLWPAAIALAFAFAAPAAFADDMSKDSMSKDKGMKKETMSKDGMSKDNMSKDTMSKDKMSK